MWDWAKRFGSGLKENSDGLNAFGSLLGGAGALWGAISANRAAKKQNEFMRNNYNFNLSLIKDEKARQKKMQQSLEQGWAGAMGKSALSEEERKNNGLF